MPTNKKGPIVFLLPDSMRDRDFAVCFEKYIKDMTKVITLDMNEIQIKPKSGIEARLLSFREHKFEARPIKVYNPLLNCKY